MVYVCGPAAMMKATAARAHGSPVEVSVENYFGCGIGICAGCSIETPDGRKRACVDGPVFSGAASHVGLDARLTPRHNCA